jgi:predicted O-methyltransferase YrrM
MRPPLRKLPWLVHDSIAFIEKHLRSKSVVLEFGSGASTVWLDSRCAKLVSVDNDTRWHQQIKEHTLQNTTMLLLPRSYDLICDVFPDKYFNLILIDGRDRVLCAKKAERVIKRGGLIVLDNSERPKYAEIFELYKDFPRQDFIQKVPDSEGFYYEGWTTTIWRIPR